MEESAIFAGLTEIFREVFADDNLSLRPDMTPDDIPGWDSTQTIMIVLAVQDRFGLKLHSREVDKLYCVGDLVDIVRAKS